MLSAFGVDHGEFYKSYKKLVPKLIKAEAGLAKQPETLHTRVRENYIQWRGQAGRPGLRDRIHRKMDKEGAEAMVTAAGNMNRQGRKLP